MAEIDPTYDFQILDGALFDRFIIDWTASQS
jgi:hypothetical protein